MWWRYVGDDADGEMMMNQMMKLIVRVLIV
jgi:hypothetical protein